MADTTWIVLNEWACVSRTRGLLLSHKTCGLPHSAFRLMVSLFCVTAVDLGLTGRGCWRPPARESVMVIAPVHNPPRPLLSFPAPTPHAPPFKSHPHCLRHGVDWINSYDEKWRARASGGKRKKATASLWLCFSRMPLFHSLSPPHQHTHTHTHTHAHTRFTCVNCISVFVGWQNRMSFHVLITTKGFFRYPFEHTFLTF